MRYQRLDLAAGTGLRLNGVEWTVDAVEAQRGLVVLRDAEGERQRRPIRWLMHHPDCRPVRTIPASGAERPFRSVTEADLTEVQRAQLRLRTAHMLEAETGYRGGHHSRALPGEPRPAYDPAGTTLGQRRRAKAAELGALGAQEAAMLGLAHMSERCGGRKPHPGWSGGMSVLMDGAAESVLSADAQPLEFVGVGDRLGQRTERRRLLERSVRPVRVVMPFELAQRTEQVTLIPDQCAVEEFVAAGADPALRDRVHTGYADAGDDGADPGVGEDLVEQPGELPVPVADEERGFGLGVFEVHGEVAGGLGHPHGGRVRRGAEDPDPAGGVLDDREDVLTLPVRGDRFEEVAREDRLGLGAQERGPGGGAALGCGVDACVLEELPDGGGCDAQAEDSEFTVDAAVAPGPGSPAPAGSPGRGSSGPSTDARVVSDGTQPRAGGGPSGGATAGRCRGARSAGAVAAPGAAAGAAARRARPGQPR